MVRRLKGIACFLFAAALGCVPLSPDRAVEVLPSGMIKIPGAGGSFHQGWDDSLASFDERPGMHCDFTYDYWIDSTEITQKEYCDITGRNPVAPGSQNGAGDDYPVYYVSWFDAVLFCNARSMAEGLDTVYRYSRINALPNGTVNELTGLLGDMSRDGYRLPTEAEWEYAAREASSALPFSAASDSAYSCYYSWNAENSLNKTHEVATRLPNALGLYDMAGNVFEWTNDWKCMYNGRRITNSLGAIEPGDEYEKVIKGGSYNYPMMYLRPSHRSATYATMLSSANAYVGFRCARGIIPKGQYIGEEEHLASNEVAITADWSDMVSFLGTSDIKLVFVNVTGVNRTLCCVDFSRAFPYVLEYVDDIQVYHPVLSPDGRYVAYCSRNEGQTGPSKVRIRSLDSLNTPIVQLSSDTAYIPRWWIDPGTGDTSIVYTNSGVDNGNVLWSQTGTYLQVVRGGVPFGSPVAVISGGSYHDGLSVKGRYAVTGFTRLMRRDLMTGIDSQLFVYPENGKDATGSSQVCNVSMDPDTGDSVRCMFLDFGYPRTSTVTACSYGVHEYLFVSDMGGKVVDYLRCPAGESSWEGVEWSNQCRFAVGCVRDGSQRAHAVYAIDLEGKSSRRLVEGTELQQPFLLSGDPFFFALDSLGRYADPLYYEAQYFLGNKMLLYWRYCDSLEIAITGSSIASYGINPALIRGGSKIFNLAAPESALLGQTRIILDYIINHSPEMKLICSGLDVAMLPYQGGDNTWTWTVAKSKGYLYDSSHDFWRNGMSRDLTNLIRKIPLLLSRDTVNLGFVALPSLAGFADPPTINPLFPIWDTTSAEYKQNLAIITETADTLQSRGIHWLLILFPLSPLYRFTDRYSPSGPLWTTLDGVVQDLQELDSANACFHFYDASIGGNHDYEYSDFADDWHLSGKGAAKLSVRIDSIIQTIVP